MKKLRVLLLVHEELLPPPNAEGEGTDVEELRVAILGR